MELLPNVHWIAGVGSNMYLCVDEDGLTLVDAGMPWHMDRVLRYIEHLRYQHADLRRIVITHADIDHAGSLAAIQEATGAIILASEATAAFLVKGSASLHLPSWFTPVFKRMKYRPVSPDSIEIIQPNQNLPFLGNCHAIATPGHTPDHHAYFSEDHGVLFCGDAIMHVGGKLRLGPAAITHDTEAAKRSALALLELTPAIMTFGHGNPLTDHKDMPLMMLYKELTA